MVQALFIGTREDMADLNAWLIDQVHLVFVGRLHDGRLDGSSCRDVGSPVVAVAVRYRGWEVLPIKRIEVD
jgi:hypothetical protein